MPTWMQRLLGPKKPSEAPSPEEPVGPLATSRELLQGSEHSSDNEAVPGEDDPPEERSKGWIGIDLDGTLAYYSAWKGFEHIGPPIPAMVLRLRAWLEQGYEVRIMTARASVEEGIPPVRAWLAKHDLPDLEVTCRKDFDMIELWDDRAVQVVCNSGSPVLSSRFAALPRAPLFGMEKLEGEAARLAKNYGTPSPGGAAEGTAPAPNPEMEQAEKVKPS
jgi:hypothetical protein